MRELNCVVEYLVPEEVVSDVDVLGAIMIDRVLGQQDGRIVVVEDRSVDRPARVQGLRGGDGARQLAGLHQLMPCIRLR